MNLSICSLNQCEGTGGKHENIPTGLERKTLNLYTARMFTVLKKQIPCGLQNGDIRLFLVDKLAVSVGFCLTTPSALKSENPSLTETVDSLSAISKQNRNVLL